MVKKNMSAMDRVKHNAFAKALLETAKEGNINISKACRMVGISRYAAYSWLGHYDSDRPQGEHQGDQRLIDFVADLYRKQERGDFE